MEEIEDSSKSNEKGINLFNSWRATGNKSELESAIQYFNKAIAGAKTESVLGHFPIAEDNLRLSKQELLKLNENV